MLTRLEKKEPSMVNEVINNQHAGRWGSEWHSIPSSLTPLLIECDKWCRSHSSNHLSHPCPNNPEGQKMKWFCESSKRNQELVPVIALSALPWKAPTGSQRAKPYTAFIVQKSNHIKTWPKTDIVHILHLLKYLRRMKDLTKSRTKGRDQRLEGLNKGEALIRTNERFNRKNLEGTQGRLASRAMRTAKENQDTPISPQTFLSMTRRMNRKRFTRALEGCGNDAIVKQGQRLKRRKLEDLMNDKSQE